ncbi:aldehyde dehydrogenase (NADP(+)) [Amylibacter sp. SFDW26]|uniref:aldehyde dehydrogenase (NADP(+)) n=1 Tax=Amylibacter sp. SFDW26 TaxID=2652722 RepID=UPI00126259CF|nr:aldehyde dehydrogenase (NADP(+)) [Amylibacter sp. SFDW26]KAB7610168.1 aldehyde dehydrogenase (NADP(+)) [Amylibacter sp. SFDW26]
MLTGKNLIDGSWVTSDQMAASEDLGGFEFSQATVNQVDTACLAARRDFRTYAGKSRAERATFLRTIAEQIDALGQEITETGMKETGLPEMRLNGERGRTTGQLRMFADLIEDTKYLDTRVDEAMPNREPLPRADLRLTHRPIGPVVVFGASNFPLAFSTAGGDTASALAAGCPVIVKGHGAHAGTAELVGQAIATAAKICDMPSGVFQILQGSGRTVGQALVQHPEIRAVGFTGSLAGGRALYDLCHSRSQPIPFYGEMGSVNPVFLLPNALKARGGAIGAGWAGSLTMGAGQFCTNPGVVVGVKGDDFDAFTDAALSALNDAPEQKMLTDGIHEAYQTGVKDFAALMDEVSSCARSDKPRHSLPAVFKIDADTWMNTPKLQHEVFGAAGVLVECDNTDQMIAVAEVLEGQLTATMHLDDADISFAQELALILEEKAGRLLCNGFPTGVEVCDAMMHGGPYPSSTDVRATSVGTLAIVRWLRPVSYQDFPEVMLHSELQSN